jgi:protein-S-isoprenylcysteine O-methyltransferase Ste14
MPRNRRALFSTSVLVLALGGQIVLTCILYDRRASDLVANIGWIILWSSAILGVLPIPTLRKWGGGRAGESYIHTTHLVDRGIYAVVRHPQYLAGMLLGVGLSLVAQHWAVAALGVAVVFIFYRVARQEEQALLDKLGAAYEGYMEQVPAFNLLAGLMRHLRRRRGR